ncbi:PPOX class F420-dependent oxidoreductase [Ktedonobacter robiniae]|uniref:PPOX class F420-dependent oxidoreductase n=1 Tax=Ktedonobacter robiniae TaxID=2778365 RepID=A0ABQ3UW07_9CHLR|nr:PPOX class F420-dependent oxidoreductase [Ktedonobacter robiniae]GHO56873.1 PPOX class F420-dependent oxidoreductase [Ktedonobacter robiniae]
MSVFTEAELKYMQSQRLGRLATVNAKGEPQVAPVSFRYNPELDTIDIGGHNMGQSQKFRNIARNGRASFVIDDVLPPWKPRCLEIRGRAEALGEGGQAVMPQFSSEVIRLKPSRIIYFDSTDPDSGSRRDVE